MNESQLNLKNCIYLVCFCRYGKKEKKIKNKENS